MRFIGVFMSEGAWGGIDDCGVKVWEVDGGEEEVRKRWKSEQIEPE